MVLTSHPVKVAVAASSVAVDQEAREVASAAEVMAAGSPEAVEDEDSATLVAKTRKSHSMKTVKMNRSQLPPPPPLRPLLQMPVRNRKSAVSSLPR